MKFNLNAASFMEELHYNQSDALIITSGSVLETKASFEHTFGDVRYKEIKLEIGNILVGDYQIKEALVLSSEMTEPTIEMHFNLGNTIRMGEDGFASADIYGMRQNILGVQRVKGFVEFEADTSYKTFDIHLSVDFVKKWYGQNKVLDRFIDDFERNRTSTLYPDAMHITPDMQRIIGEISNCPYSGFMQKMYLEAKIQELFILQLDLCECMMNIGNQYKQSLSPADIERIHEAKRYIEEHLNQPKTIIELAHLVGTNESKLKRGFKQLFGTTVFGYMQQRRMEQARRMFIEENKSVSEVALFVGYANLSNFTNAFKVYFGFPPTMLKSGIPY